MKAPKEEPQRELIYRLSRVVGHEIRNPLAVIKNSAYYVKAKLSSAGGADPKIEKHLSIIESEITRADKIIADIVAYARPAELKVEVEPVNDLVSEVLASVTPPANVSVEKTLGPAKLAAAMDREAIKGALLVLVQNALDALPDGGTVKVLTILEKGRAVIEVRDSGKGFKAEDAERLFWPFFTTKPRGLGLGLAGASRTVLAHHGRLTAETSPSGAAFRISLPAK